MTTCGIVQNQYIPWLGFWALMDSVDVFVLLDSVPLSKQSWQTRNRIQARDGNTVWLSVPVHAKLGQRIDTVRIDNSRPWQRKHWATIKQAYSHLPGWPLIRDATEWAYLEWANHGEWDGLTILTTHLIQSLAKTLGITTRIVRASDLRETRDDKHGRIVDLCHSVGATTYVSTTGASYLEQTGLEDISLEWFHYQHPVYPQGQGEFTSHLSVLDCIAHCGDQALGTIRKGFYATQCGISAKSATESR